MINTIPQWQRRNLEGLGATPASGVWEELNVWVSNSFGIDYGLAQGLTVTGLLLVAFFVMKTMRN